MHVLFVVHVSYGFMVCSSPLSSPPPHDQVQDVMSELDDLSVNNQETLNVINHLKVHYWEIDGTKMQCKPTENHKRSNAE